MFVQTKVCCKLVLILASVKLRLIIFAAQKNQSNAPIYQPTMNYAQTVTYLFSQLPMFQRVGAAAFKKDLTNTLALCAAMGNPHLRIATVHVGGTNGKGSTAHAIAAILQTSGYKTGLYISPHYRDFRERIKINGEYISQDEVVSFTARYRPLFDEVQPSFFEMTVAMAFDHFARHAVDVAVIEVGMGGRFDSTNVIMPRLSVITNISYDHTQFLGNTLALIAVEKAGIIKAQVPVVIGETHPETENVFRQKAADCQAPIAFADQCYALRRFSAQLTQTSTEIYALNPNNHSVWANNAAATKGYDLQTDLTGNYQQPNLVTIWQAAEWLPQVGFGRVNPALACQALQQVKKTTRFFGRWQVLGRQPLVIADSAHNPAGLHYAMQQLCAMPYHKLHIVLGMVADKDISQMLAILPTHATYYFCKADIPRGLAADRLAAQAAEQGLHGIICLSVADALQTALAQAHIDDVVYVGGSIFVVAEVLTD